MVYECPGKIVYLNRRRQAGGKGPTLANGTLRVTGGPRKGTDLRFMDIEIPAGVGIGDDIMAVCDAGGSYAGKYRVKAIRRN